VGIDLLPSSESERAYNAAVTNTNGMELAPFCCLSHINCRYLQRMTSMAIRSKLFLIMAVILAESGAILVMLSSQAADRSAEAMLTTVSLHRYGHGE
jgi:hypothetical protein